MAWGYKREVARKFVHLLALFFIAIYIFFAAAFSHQIGVLALVSLLVILIIFEYCRIELKANIPLVSLFWGVKRPKERDVPGAEIFFLMGAIICFSAFDMRIAVAAMLMAIFGDLSAALVGIRFGKHKLPYLKPKSWEGTIAELAVNIVIGALIVKSAPVIAAMALVATAAETATKKIDDNLIVPVFAGLSGQLALAAANLFL